MRMDFSVLIATWNRPALFERALNSILAQTHRSFEVIAVNDKSDDEFADEYREIEGRYGGRIRYFLMDHRLGHSGCLNYGMRQARGEYICFLDDDDMWVDTGHLGKAIRAIFGKTGRADIYFADEELYYDDRPFSGRSWAHIFTGHVKRITDMNESGVYEVTAKDIMSCNGYSTPHLNALIVKKDLMEAVGGHNEALQYEGDLDFFLKVVDRAKKIVYSPEIVARHNIPDPGKKSSMSTRVNYLEKIFYRLDWIDEIIAYSKKKEVVRYAKKHKVYTIKKLAEYFHKDGRYDLASWYAGEALFIGFNIKWLLYCIFLMFKSRVKMARNR